MSTQQDNNPVFELPPIERQEAEPSRHDSEQYGVSSNEIQKEIAIEQGASQPAPPSPPPPASPSQAPIPPPAAPSTQSQVSSVPVVTPKIADDTDLIEKEWVDKAKEIVARTSKDPHQQNIEMNKFKAEYLKKRYDKDVKLSKDS